MDIILVEDNPSDVALSMYAFKKEGLADRVQIVRDGAEALDFLFCSGEYAARRAGDLPKVILLDLHLPKVDGLEVLRKIKADPRTMAIPVVVLTSSSEDHRVDECYRLGANSFIVKPIDTKQFMTVTSGLGLYWLRLNRTSSSTDQADRLHE